MSAFEDFVQLELPKRPYLEDDVPLETVIVRRGIGPRQLAGVTLSEGEVLGMLNGVLTGVLGGGGGGGAGRGFQQTIGVADVTWTVLHGGASANLIAQVTDINGFVIIPDELQIVDVDTVVVHFSTPQTGVIRILFLD